jgi:hypothetical protein
MSSNGTQRVPLDSLVVDESLTPRKVDHMHVRALVDALESGDTLPAIIVDANTQRIVDGRHRYEAHRRMAGGDATIEVEFRSYATELDVWSDAVEANATNAKPYSPYEQRKIVVASQARGMDMERIASILHVPAHRLERRSAVGYVIERRGVSGQEIARRPVPLKRSLQHLHGANLTPAQEKANAHNSGHKPDFHAHQLVLWIESGTLEPYLQKPGVVRELRKLRDLLANVELVAPESESKAEAS